MTERVHRHPSLIFSEGTQIVCLREIFGQGGRKLHPKGAVGVIVQSPVDLDHSYRVRFLDGLEVALQQDELVMLAHFKEGEIGDSQISIARSNLYDRVIFRCVIGSRAYGLDDQESDTDYRGIYLPPADLHWSLYGVPEQIECYETQEHYWELQRFLVLALKANPNVLECLYTPLIEKMTPLADELLKMRSVFLSKMVYKTYNGYVNSQYKKILADISNRGKVHWKHAMHLIRLLISGISILRNGFVQVQVDKYRDELLTIKKGGMSLEETDKWRHSLHAEFDQALSVSNLPERPDYEQANALLVKARRMALSGELP
jgi:predicted nucleotidyltransferase